MALETALIVTAITATAAVAAQGVSNYYASRAQADSADFDADVQEFNARVVKAETGAAEDDQRRRARAMLSNQRSAAASRGLQLTGSAWDLYMESAVDAERDALEVRRVGKLNAKGLELQSAASRFSAGSYRQGAILGAGASALSAGATAARGYGNYQAGTARAPTAIEVD